MNVFFKNKKNNILNNKIKNSESYFAWINKFPTLTKKEEFYFSKKFIEENNLNAAKKLITSNLKFVVKIAKKYKSYGLQEYDLIQEGNIGLMKAVKKFNYNLNVRLITFAQYWIQHYITEFIIKNWRIVKIATTSSQKKLFFNLKKFNSNKFLSKEDIDTIKNKLHVNEKDIINMEKKLYHCDKNMESNNELNSFKEKKYSLQYLAEKKNEPYKILELEEKNKIINKIFSLLSYLDHRSKFILQNRWFQEKKKKLKYFAEKYNISQERVRQIEKIAFKKIKFLLNKYND